MSHVPRTGPCNGTTGISNTTDEIQAAFGPATIVVTASPAAGLEKQWELALSELIRAALSFAGHLSTTVLRPILCPLPGLLASLSH